MTAPFRQASFVEGKENKRTRETSFAGKHGWPVIHRALWDRGDHVHAESIVPMRFSYGGGATLVDTSRIPRPYRVPHQLRLGSVVKTPNGKPHRIYQVASKPQPAIPLLSKRPTSPSGKTHDIVVRRQWITNTGAREVTRKTLFERMHTLTCRRSLPPPVPRAQRPYRRFGCRTSPRLPSYNASVVLADAGRTVCGGSMCVAQA